MGGDRSSRTEELNNMLVEALRTREFTGVADVFADDATMLLPRRGAVSGRESIQSFWSQASRIKELKFDTLSVAALGDDVVREIGTLLMRAGPGGRRAAAEDDAIEGTTDESRVLSGTYLFLWRQTGGQWYLDTCIWNTRQQQDEEARAGRLEQRREERREQRRSERRAGRRAERRSERLEDKT
jgi:uncharacterized protein (TIGR02246 family)